MFMTLYKSMIRPYMEYATAVWSPHLQKDIFILENAQRRATRLVKGIKDLSYEDRLRFLGLPTLIYRRARCDLIQVFKIVNKIDNLDKEIFFKENNSSMTRGHNYKLSKGHNRLNLRAHAFSQRIVNPWNSLSAAVVNSKDVNQFKSNLNVCWKNHPLKFEHIYNKPCANNILYTRNVAKMGHHYPRDNKRPGDS